MQICISLFLYSPTPIPILQTFDPKAGLSAGGACFQLLLPDPGPSAVLIRPHSSSRQSAKHWGKIFCLPEQLLINCPFIDAQDKSCFPASPSFHPSLPPALLYSFSHVHSCSAPCGLVKLAHLPHLSMNYRSGSVGQSALQTGTGTEDAAAEESSTKALKEMNIGPSPPLSPSRLPASAPRAGTTPRRFRFVIAQLVPSAWFSYITNG